MINKNLLSKILVDREDWIDIFLIYLEKYNIDSSLRLCNFFAQVMHETSDLTKLEENLRYKDPNRLMTIFPSVIKDLKTANECILNPKKLAELKYKNFQGRGILHLTWEDNYRKSSLDIYGNDSLLKNPELVSKDKKVAIETGCWFWKCNNLNKYADLNDIDSITQIINGKAKLGLEDRKSRLEKYSSFLCL